ncbi:VirK family protein [Fluoribacter dumoffii]|nr:VirK family protein [Fluoribacter dumoffii]MCW8385298.1 VirK family protein [Fluoribacter dumoffii]MCW8418352.1 VirK family protein [Fluoribacter dumoffii]MCW8453806.1 VirK family protein [Fluoribacter dumoffii]MCW8462123.1 VirK family protein [Fluoribacter dumoffii]MCW8482335.1 VirK family protein [Fluoribacter dumoffii]
MDNPLARGKPVFEYVKYTINADGRVSIKNTIMDATNYHEFSSFQIDCDLNKGFKVFD